MKHLRPTLCAVLLFSTPAWADAPPDPATADLRRRAEQLSLENGVADQQLRKELAKLLAEKQRLELENAVAQQKLQAELAARNAELERLGRQAELLARRSAVKEAERRARLDAELADARDKLERARVQNDLATAQLAAKARDLALREQELRVRGAELQVARGELDQQVARVNADLELREKRDQWRGRVHDDIKYTREPYNAKDRVLTISDRRIGLNGVITMQTAAHVTERVNYYNNLSHEYPIFLVIDESPGGSVAAGYQILKTMSGSPAPVYVVVKTLAASMAANIATQAVRSFAYPNAIILHHQMLWGAFGNVTEQREEMKEHEEWWRRLAAPVAAKMGISLDEFIKHMYQHRSSGDWREFGDQARRIKWVDEIADVIREESYVRNPDAQAPSFPLILPPRHALSDGLAEETDSSGRPFVRLPRLSPVDCYYLYNPDHYYRLTP